MKTLILVRHAKSSWDNSVLTDFERPLNERGKHDAPQMAKRLKQKELEIDLFISSPAKRAKKTAEIFMHEFDLKEKNLLTIPALYEASVEKFLEVVSDIKDKNHTVALFAHNPGLTDFINLLECYPVYEMPTCGVFALKIKSKKWKDIKDAEKEFLFFDYPKNK
ncbi:MAG: histidine phosphatase family protein [Ginsengibacter sp.]